jgi:hypothetical protein
MDEAVPVDLDIVAGIGGDEVLDEGVLCSGHLVPGIAEVGVGGGVHRHSTTHEAGTMSPSASSKLSSNPGSPGSRHSCPG